MHLYRAGGARDSVSSPALTDRRHQIPLELISIGTVHLVVPGSFEEKLQ
jgi:hypothetical protein